MKIPSVDEIYDLILSLLKTDQADDVVVIDLRRQAHITDYLIIASGRSVRHLSSIAKHLKENLYHVGIRDVSIEGMPYCEWVLIDAGDIVIHLFRPLVRQFYNLEKFWTLSSDIRDDHQE